MGTVFFNNFWSEFVHDQDPISSDFFKSLLEKIFNKTIIVSKNMNDADILFESVFGGESLCNVKKWNYTFLFSGEFNYRNKHINLDSYSCVLGCEKSGNCVVLPLFLPHFLCNPHSLEPVLTVPERMACATFTYFPGKVCATFLDKLEKKTGVSHGGLYKNNCGPLTGDYTSLEFELLLKKHKFAICMENNKGDYYITEKIMNGFRAGIIPVYWGASNISQYFNTRRFLQLSDESEESMENLIETMLNMSDEEYISRIHEPIFIKNADELLNDVVADVKTCLQNEQSLKKSLIVQICNYHYECLGIAINYVEKHTKSKEIDIYFPAKESDYIQFMRHNFDNLKLNYVRNLQTTNYDLIFFMTSHDANHFIEACMKPHNIQASKMVCISHITNLRHEYITNMSLTPLCAFPILEFPLFKSSVRTFYSDSFYPEIDLFYTGDPLRANFEALNNCLVSKNKKLLFISYNKIDNVYSNIVSVSNIHETDMIRCFLYKKAIFWPRENTWYTIDRIGGIIHLAVSFQTPLYILDEVYKYYKQYKNLIPFNKSSDDILQTL